MLKDEFYHREGSKTLHVCFHGYLQDCLFPERCKWHETVTDEHVAYPRSGSFARGWTSKHLNRVIDYLWMTVESLEIDTLYLLGHSDGATYLHSWADEFIHEGGEVKGLVHYGGLWEGTLVECPVHFFLGENDPIPKVVRETNKAAVAYNKEVTLIPNAKHHWHIPANGVILDKLYNHT